MRGGVEGCGGGVGLPGARVSGLAQLRREPNVGLPRTFARDLEGGPAAVRRGVTSVDDLRPSV